MTRYISTKENPNGDIMPEDIGKYTNLHAHSIFSPLDGFGKLDEYCERAKALGFKGLCLSEHGNMMGHLKQRDACKKHGLKPIYANEGYFTLQSGNLKEKVEGYKSAYHILLIAMNEEGYKNLMKMTSIAWIKYKYYKPRFDLELMEECSEGIICTSACLGGAISQLLLSGKEEEAEEVALRLKHIYKDRFYLELTYTGLEEQDVANKFLKQLSIKHNIPLVITTDSHYVYPWQSDAHAKLVMINTGGVINKAVKETSLSDNKKEESDVDNSGMFYQPGQYYVKPWHVLHEEYYNDELDAIAFENSNKIAEMCNVDLKYEDKMIFPKPYENPHEVLTSKVMEWYKDYTKGFPEDKKKEYLDRLELELSVYDKMDFSSYPLVLEDIIDYCKANDIWTGPGRGCSEKSLRIIVLRDGLIEYDTIDNIKPGEYVLGHSGEFKPVLNAMKYDINEEMYEIKTYYSDRISKNVLTSDHMIMIDGKGWVQAKDVKPGDFVKLPILNPIGRRIDYIDLAEYIDDDKYIVTDSEIIYRRVVNKPFDKSDKLSSIVSENKTKLKKFIKLVYLEEDIPDIYTKIKDAVISVYGTLENMRIAISNSWDEKILRYINIDENFIYYLGQFVGNGHVRKDCNDIVTSICFNIKHSEKIQNIVSFCDHIGIRYRVRTNKSVILVEARNKLFNRFMRDIFSRYKSTSNSKYIPDFIFGLDRSLIERFLMGYMSADGYYDASKKSWKVATVSSELRDGFKKLCMILGYACTIYWEDRIFSSIQLAEGNKSYTMTMKTPDLYDRRYCYIDNGFLCMRVQEVIKYDQYETSVYDIEVQDDHSYVTSSYVQHNSAAGSLISYALGLTQIDPIPYGLMFSRYLSAGRAKYPLIEFDGYPLNEWK